MAVNSNNLNLCGICNTNIVRKSIICSTCFKHFHSFCINSPKLNFRCGDCVIANSSVNPNSPNMDIEVQNSIKKIMADIAHLKSKQNEFAASIKQLKNLEENSADVSRTLDSIQTSLINVAKLEDRVVKVEKNIEILARKSNDCLSGGIINSNKIELVQKRCDILENYAYQANCEIRGIPTVQNENLFKIVNLIATKIGFELNNSQIKYIHRTYSLKQPKPIVVEFISKFIRNSFLECFRLHGKNGKIYAKDVAATTTNSQIFIAEHISSWKKKLLSDCKLLKKDFNFKHVWVKFGKIYCKLEDDSIPVKISSFDELNSFRKNLGSGSNAIVEPDATTVDH